LHDAVLEIEYASQENTAKLNLKGPACQPRSATLSASGKSCSKIL
jgi:hypothetical protein